MKASDVMVRDVGLIRGSETVAKAIARMNETGSRYLIVERRHDEDAYGIVTETDVITKVIAYGKNPHTTRVFEIMSKPCIVVNPNLGIEYVARLFANTGIHCAPVIQEQLIGAISMTDILIKGNLIEAPPALKLEERIQQAIIAARETCAQYGATSTECMIAWETVEELQAEAAHQRAERPEKTAFEQYCEEFPEALEARMYEV
ncbi:MAG TPA: CBS domain-containing protein [Synechococcales cyanobacterium M55_K2018_004]|nr:CBS domain-containing protein [Synechococcales cyanobacterium M55_K2018_004]